MAVAAVVVALAGDQDCRGILSAQESSSSMLPTSLALGELSSFDFGCFYFALSCPSNGEAPSQLVLFLCWQQISLQLYYYCFLQIVDGFVSLSCYYFLPIFKHLGLN